VHYWADLQLVHGFRCYDNTAPNAKCQPALVLVLCLVVFITSAKEDRRCLFVCLCVCVLASLRKNFRTDLHEIFRDGRKWATEQTIKFWWIATLVRRALVEICAVLVILVLCFSKFVFRFCCVRFQFLQY